MNKTLFLYATVALVGLGLVGWIVLFTHSRSNKVDRFGISDRPEVAAIPKSQRDAMYYEWHVDGKWSGKGWKEEGWAWDLDALFEQRRHDEVRDLFVALTYGPKPLPLSQLAPLKESELATKGVRAKVDLASVNEYRRLSPVEIQSDNTDPEFWLTRLRQKAKVVQVESLEVLIYQVKPDGTVIAHPDATAAAPK